MSRHGTIAILARCWLCHGDWRVGFSELDPDKGLILQLHCEECPNRAWMRVEVFDQWQSDIPRAKQVQQESLL